MKHRFESVVPNNRAYIIRAYSHIYREEKILADIWRRVVLPKIIGTEDRYMDYASGKGLKGELSVIDRRYRERLIDTLDLVCYELGVNYYPCAYRNAMRIRDMLEEIA